MDFDSATTSHELSYQELLHQNNNGSGIDDSDRPPGCGLCGRTLSLEDEVNVIRQNVSICDDCKFLLLEDLDTPVRSSGRRTPGRSRSLYDSSGSTENLFSPQFSQIINFARQVEPGHEETFDSNSRLLQPSTSSHTTPNSSRRQRILLSDTESDVSNSDGESESNISYGRYYHGDSDAMSFSIYEGDSDSSVDCHPLFSADIAQSGERSDLDGDSDIDVMHAGNVLGDFDDNEEVGNVEWEVDNEDNTVNSSEFGAPHRGGSGSLIRRRRTDSIESVETIRWRTSEVNLQISRMHIGMEEPSEAPFRGDPGNYLDARDFVEFLEHIEESERFRSGAPPASTSFVNNLPLIPICEEHQNSDGLTCAICKDLLTIGTIVNQLPCFHLYHPNCILPWLNTRNSCPICRYELPTDDIDYELGKLNAGRGVVIPEIETQGDQDDNSSIMTDLSVVVMDEAIELGRALEDVGPTEDISQSNRQRGGWFLLAAAPIVSLMGIVFVLWLGSAQAAGGQGQVGQVNSKCGTVELIIHTSGLCPRNEQKRWWWF